MIKRVIVGAGFGVSIAATAMAASTVGLATSVTEVCPGNRANCCPSGYTNDVMSSQVFQSGASGQCVVGSANVNTIAAQGGSSIVIGGPNTDIIQAANGNNFVVPGPGLDIVSTGVGDDTVAIYDLCEMQAGETIDLGTGFNTLISPVPLEQLQARGLNITNVSQVVIQQNSCKSACIEQPDCSGNGSCVEGAQQGQVACKCKTGYSGEHCEVLPVAPTELTPKLQSLPLACFAPSFTGTLQGAGTEAKYTSIHYATPNPSKGVCAPQFCDDKGNPVAGPTEAQLNSPPPAGSKCSAFGDANCPVDPATLTTLCAKDSECRSGEVCSSHCVDAACSNIEHRCGTLVASCSGLPAEANCDEFRLCPLPGAVGTPDKARLAAQLTSTSSPSASAMVPPGAISQVGPYSTVSALVCAPEPEAQPVALTDTSNKPASDGSQQWGVFATPISGFHITPVKRTDGIGELAMDASGGLSAGGILFGTKVEVINANVGATVDDCGVTINGVLKVFGEAIATWSPSAGQAFHLASDNNGNLATPALSATNCKTAREATKTAIAATREANLLARAVKEYYGQAGLTPALCNEIKQKLPGRMKDPSGQPYDCDNLATIPPVQQVNILNAWADEYSGDVGSYADFSNTLGSAHQAIQTSGTIDLFKTPHPYNLHVFDQDFPIGPITLNIAVEGYGAWNLSGGVQFGVGFDGNFTGAGNVLKNVVNGQLPTLGDIRAYAGPVVTPALQTGIQAFVGVGIPGVSIGIQGSIDLLDISVPSGVVVAAERLSKPDSRSLTNTDFAGTPAPALAPTDYRWVTGFNWNSQVIMSELNGEVDLAARIHFLFFSHTFKVKMFSWPGLQQNFTLVSDGTGDDPVAHPLAYASDIGTQADDVAYTPIPRINVLNPNIGTATEPFPFCQVVPK